MFLIKTRSTRDTVRFYIEQGLLTPSKKAGKYNFTDQSVDDYQEIIALKQMGLSIAAIKAIKKCMMKVVAPLNSGNKIRSLYLKH
mgnify:CR=1 FL=1